MNAEQMTRLAEAARLLRQAKAIVEAVRDAADEEQANLPERLRSTEIEDAAESSSIVLQNAARSVESALEDIAEVTGEDDPTPPPRAEPLPETRPPRRR
jgi:hypothetical protein